MSYKPYVFGKIKHKYRFTQKNGGYFANIMKLIGNFAVSGRQRHISFIIT